MIRERLSSQLLSGPRATSAEEVVHRLLAVQAQDPRGARLSIRARSTGISAAAVDFALTEQRSLLIAWLCRGTLHLVASADYWWLHPLTTPQLATGNARRLRQEGVSPQQADAGVEVILERLADGPKTREELRKALEIPTAGQALIHLLLRASITADVVRAADWLGPAPEPLERPDALASLAKRYLAGHAPATAEDLAKWAGIALRDARAGFASITNGDEQASAHRFPHRSCSARSTPAARVGIARLHRRLPAFCAKENIPPAKREDREAHPSIDRIPQTHDTPRVHTAERMQQTWRGLLLLLIAGVAVGCGNGGHDIEIAGSLLRVAGDDHAEFKVAASDLESYRGLSSTSSALSDAGKALSGSELFNKLRENLSDFNEQTEGPIRSAIVETACDSAVDPQTTSDEAKSNLERHLVAKIGSREQEALSAAKEAASNLQ